MNKLTITKVYFPTVTVIKVDDGVQSRYYTSTEPGVMYPSIDVVETEFKWQEVLEEAKAKGAKVEVEEFLLQGGEPPGGFLPGKPLPERFRPTRPFPKTYGEWVNLAEDIKERRPDDPLTVASVNYNLSLIAHEEEMTPADVDEAKRWLVDRATELGIY